MLNDASIVHLKFLKFIRPLVKIHFFKNWMWSTGVVHGPGVHLLYTP